MWTNRAWQQFSLENDGAPDKTGVGSNYIAHCENIIGEERGAALAVCNSVQSVLHGSLEEAPPIEYPCHAPWEKRWFLVSVFKVESKGQIYAAIVHENVTVRRMLTEEMAILKQRLREFESKASMAEWVGVLSHEIKNPLTVILNRAELDGAASLVGPSRNPSLDEFLLDCEEDCQRCFEHRQWTRCDVQGHRAGIL